ncbi:MAG: hypothetical protein R2761_11580 [Acidimicrobiales bacterium]
MGDETDRAGRAFRRVMAAATAVLVGSWLVMNAATGLLQAMSPGTCRPGGIIDAQFPGATRAELTETVTGWVLFDLETRGFTIDPGRCALAASPAVGGAPATAAGAETQPDSEPRTLDVRSGLSIARAWLLTDLLGFMPAYVVLLVGAQRWAAQRRMARRGSTSVPAGLVGAFAAHPALALAAVVGGLADAAENLQILARLGRWWRVDDLGPNVVIGSGALRLVHLAGGIKTVLVAVATLGALVSVAAWLAGRARPVLDAGRHLWVQAAVAAVFTVGLLVPGQSSDAVRRLSPTQWVASLGALCVLAAVLALTGYGALKPRAAGLAGSRATAGDGRGGGLRIRWLESDSPHSVADWGRWLRGRPGALRRLVTVERLRATRVGLTVTLAGLAVVAASVVLPWRGLRVPGGLVALVGLASLAIDAATATRSRPGAADDNRAWQVEPAGAAAAGGPVQPPPPRGDLGLRLRIAALIGGLVPAALAVVAVRAAATDVLFLAPGGARQGQLALRLAVGLGLLAAVPLAMRGLQVLARWVGALPDSGRRRVLAALVALHAPAVLFHDPDIVVGHAHRLGALVLLAVFLSGFCLIGSMADTVSVAVAEVPWLRPYVVPSALRQLSLQRPPLMGLLVIWVALSPLGGSLNGYHTVPSLPDHPVPTPLRSNSFIEAWAAARGLDGAETGTPVADTPAADAPGADTAGAAPMPVLLVAASGGGIRAAYWTAAVVDCLVERTDGDGDDDPCADPTTDDDRARAASRRDRFLLGSGISGGSLGLTAYVTVARPAWVPRGGSGPAAGATAVGGPPGRWYADRLGDDYLAPVVASWLFNDGLNSLLRPDQGVDRGAVLERAWSASWPDGGLTRPWFNAQATGLEPLLVLNGYSVNDGCRFAVSPINTNARRTANTCRSPESDGETLLDATIDAADVLCDDITAASAALLSARFPFVSPSGRIDRCDGGPRLPESVDVVDGGYRETSGASSVVEAWPRLGTELATASGRCVVPVFVQIDNGYRSDEIAPAGSSGQLLAPLIGLSNTAAGYEAAARSASRRQFDQWFTITTRAHPGSQAPLGWVLSGDAKADLENQLQVNAEGIRAVRALLDGGVPSSTPSAICPGETPLAAGDNPGAAAQ